MRINTGQKSLGMRILVAPALIMSMATFACHRQASSDWIPSRILGMAYPRVASLARLEGNVEAKCSVNDDGSVAGVSIVSGPPLLAQSVRLNLLRWTFRRVTRSPKGSGEAVVVYSFKLAGPCDEYNRCKEEYWFEYPNRVLIESETPRLTTGSTN